MNGLIATPGMQYGFATFAMVLLGVVVWLCRWQFRQMAQLTRENHRFLAGCIRSLQELVDKVAAQTEMIAQHSALLREWQEKLFALYYREREPTHADDGADD